MIRKVADYSWKATALAFAVLVASASPGQAQPKAKKITFDEHVLPIMKDKCAGCHNLDRKRGGLVVTSYTGIMAGGSSGASVKPGDPDNSLLYKVMAHTSEPFMPPKSAKLGNDVLDVVSKWIAGGAPENAGSKVVMADRPKVDFTLSSVVKGKPSGPPPMPPRTLSLEPVVRSPRETAVTALASSPWAPLLAVAGHRQILLYNTDTLDLIGVLPFPEGNPAVLKFSRNGSLLLAGGGRPGKAGRVVIWSVEKGERLFAVGDESDCVLAADISPDQTRIALGGPSKMVRIYSTKDGKLLTEIKKHTDWVTSLEFSPDGVLLATGDRNGGMFIWEAFTAREYYVLKGPTAAITEICWRLDSNVVGVCSEDGTVRLFEMENGGQIRTWNANGGGVLGMNYSKDGRIVSAGRDRLVRLFDGNGGPQRNFETMQDVALRAVFSHDGARVFGTDWTGQIVAWNTADGKRLGVLSANPPSPAQQLVLAQAAVLEKQKQLDALTATAKASDAAYQKASADLTAAQKVVADTTAAFKAAEAKLAQVKSAVATAQTALKNAESAAQAHGTLAQALAEAAAKVKLETEKNKANPRLQEALTRMLSLSGQAAAELSLAQKTLEEMRSAAKAVETTLPTSQQAFNAAQAALAAAPKAVPPLQASLQALQGQAAANRAAVDRATQELAAAKASLARWQAASAVAAKPAK
ncbi:MAG: c-type cytochrome domain-containing protein [Gemmataceae bacterium]